MKKILAIAVLASLLTACANSDGTYGAAGTSSPMNKQNVGGLGGAVLGGLAGSQIGGGSGRLWATGAGVLIGALAGSEIGKSLDRADQTYMNQAYSKAMTAPAGQNITWSNPDSGNSGSYNTVRTGRASNGGQCREYTQTINVGGKSQQGVGQACQNPDGSWQIVSN
ncbi:MAG TPA: RT0821/Lpp0805 family surface protein [Alphaproteobacteria bacterium]